MTQQGGFTEWPVPGSRVCHPKIHLFGILIIGRILVNFKKLQTKEKL